MPLLGSTGKRRRFAYITVPEHVVKEFLKLYSVEFNGRKLVIERAKTPPKKTTGKNTQALLQMQSPAVDFEMEIFEQSPQIQQIPVHAMLPKKGVIALFFRQHIQRDEYQKYKQVS